jgi:oligopeptide/dipeptide ABC transporter ATP-binding protein
VSAGERLLEVSDLCTSFEGQGASACVVDGVELALDAGETLGLVGESGCGKTLTALSILGLVPPPGRIVRGAIRFRGRDLRALPERELRLLRGKELAMVFQEPASALDPVFSAGEQLSEVLRRHERLSRRAARERAIALLAEVGLSDAPARARAYPHELSGGQRQRVLIAIAIACRPRLLLADEPTSALDVTVQAEILALLSALQRRHGMGFLLITHDLSVAARCAWRVAVMYAGRIVEEARAAELFRRPRHPYTIALLRARPAAAPPGTRLAAIPGQVPSPLRRPEGCAFHPRCPLARERCQLEEPRLLPARGTADSRVACHFPEEALLL